MANPWRDFDDFANRLGQVFDDNWLAAPSHRGWIPAVNVEETNDEVLLTAELPGLTTDDVEVELENNVLTIRGEKREEHEEREEGNRFHRVERRFGSFKRSFTVPRSVKADEIEAQFNAGVLAVRMPKASEAKGRKIDIAVKV
jgi:HSP20 family protein